MTALLRAAVRAGIHVSYAARLLTSAEEQAVEIDPPPTSPSAVSQALQEPLSERELEVLTLIAAGLKNKEIAGELVISLNTVLDHTKNIYGKLGVNRRTLAVARARELEIIE